VWRQQAIMVIMACGCYFSCTSRSWWIAHSTQRQRRGCSTTILR